MARYDRGFGGPGGFRPRGGEWAGYDDDYGAGGRSGGPRAGGFTFGGGRYEAGPGEPTFGSWNHYGGRGGGFGLGGGGYHGGPPGNHYGGHGGYGFGPEAYEGGSYGGGVRQGSGMMGGGGQGGTFGSGHRQGGGFGSGHRQGPGMMGGGSRQGPGLMGGGLRAEGGFMGGGLRGRGEATYGGSPERWDGGYDAYDRGLYGDDHPGPANGVGREMRGGYAGGGYAGGGYGARPSQGRGYDRGWGGGGDFARAPFMPEEAYRRHPEYDQPPSPRQWEAYQHDVDEELSDDEVADSVRRRMSADAWLDPDRIEVRVDDGVVTLTGEVDDFLEARYAWDDAWETDGVRGVVNNLTVRTDRPVPTHGDVVPQSSGERPTLEAGGSTLWSEGGENT